MIYHYTTIDAFYNILALYKNSEGKDYLEFWASSILNQNDKEELSVKSEELMPVVKEIERDIKINVSNLKKLSNVDDLNWLPTLTGRNANESIKDYFQDECNIPYTMSFGQHEDDLLMWSMYANNGNGLCIAFDENVLFDKRMHSFVFPNEVVYDNDPQKCKEIIRLFYDYYLKEVKNEFVIDIIQRLKRNCWERMLMGITPFLKNKAFKEEAEYRFVYYITRETPVYTRLSRHMNIINYIKVKVPLVALKYIVIGPCANYRRSKYLLVENMKSCNIERDYNKRFIRKSKVPYRIY